MLGMQTYTHARVNTAYPMAFKTKTLSSMTHAEYMADNQRDDTSTTQTTAWDCEDRRYTWAVNIPKPITEESLFGRHSHDYPCLARFGYDGGPKICYKCLVG